ncbi:MAG: hypothetical protein J4F36_08920 [Nitrosopumilaceae archaeon]|nr:hypothetical protein [Nitrosopumilaceae archaeon]
MNQKEMRAMMTNPRLGDRISEPVMAMTIAVTSEPSSFDSLYSILIFKRVHA